MTQKLSHLRFIAIVVLLIIGSRSTLAQDNSTWLPFSQTELIRMLKEAGFENPMVQSYEEAIGADLTQPGLTEEQKARLAERNKETTEIERKRLSTVLAPGDIISAIWAQPGPLIIVVAGRADQIHSFRATVPVVNYSDADAKRVLEFISLLFTKTYPNWADAKDWHLASAQRTWEAWSRVVDKGDSSAQADLIAVHRQDGMTAATFGVPPDIIVYTITTRQRCVPSLEGKDPMQRSIC
jgi:hypothetical protein